MILRDLAPIAGAALLLAGCVVRPPLAALAVRPPPDPASQMPALESRIYVLVNAERHKLDPQAKPLTLDLELAGVAREKSADMAAHHYLAHAAPGGQTVASMVMDKDPSFQGLLGENIDAQPFSKGYDIDIDIYARRIVETWMASARHRENLAYVAYDRAGVGAAVANDTIYVTELFATDLGLRSPQDRSPAGAGSAR